MAYLVSTGYGSRQSVSVGISGGMRGVRRSGLPCKHWLW